MTLARIVESNSSRRSQLRDFQFAICILQFAIALPSIAQDARLARSPRRSRPQSRRRAVAPSVVQIRTIGGLDVVDGTLLADGPTTGLVISADGYILSSAFNFAQQPASILVTFASGKQAPAELVATDHSRMLVLLKASGVADLPVPELCAGRRSRPRPVGRRRRPHVSRRSHERHGRNRQRGRPHVSAKRFRPTPTFPRANYGGPLVDIRGRVLGVIVPMAPAGRQRSRRHRMVRLGHRFRRAARAARRAHRADEKRRGPAAGPLGHRHDNQKPAFVAGRAVRRPARFAGRSGRPQKRRQNRRDQRQADPHANRSAIRARHCLRRRRGPRRRHARR